MHRSHAARERDNNLAERHASQRAIGGEREILRDAHSGPSRAASVLQPLASFSPELLQREERAGISEPFVCATHRALQTVPYRAHALRHHAQLHTSRLPASPETAACNPSHR